MKNLSIIILIAVSIIGFITLMCLSFYAGKIYKVDPCKTDTITTTQIIPGDSIPYEVKVEVPKPYKIVVHDTVPEYMGIDTLQLIKDYLSEIFYDDTLKNDTSALVVIREMLQGNRIKDRELIFQNRRPIAIINNTITPVQANKWTVSAGIGSQFTPKFDVSLKAMLTDSYGRSYLVSRSVNGITEMGVLLPIWRKR